MRTSLLPGLLQSAARAARHGEPDARLFTVAPVFLAAGSNGGVDERLMFAAVLSGERGAWLKKAEAVDVWDAKGIAQAMVARLRGRDCVTRLDAPAERPPVLHPRGAARVEVEGRPVGFLGPLHPDVSDAFELRGAVVLVELDLCALDALAETPVRFTPLPRFPASTRDLSIVVADTIAAGEVERAVRVAAGDLAENVTLFDRFAGAGVEAHQVSLALHVVYRAGDRTLTDAEVDARHAEVVAAMATRFGATLRA
jgi:phenylalanyl-tRNA synthetase beta chain